MRVSIIKGKKIQTLLLPDRVEGSYWISDTDKNGIKRNLISIEAENGFWKLISNNDVFYVKNNASEPYAYLKLGNFYTIRNNVEDEFLVLYCSHVKTKYNYYEVENSLDSGITIGSNPSCLVGVSFLDDQAATIQRMNNKVYVIDHDSKYGVYVNNVRVLKQQELKVGDIVFMMGLKIYFTIDSNSKNKGSYYIGVNNHIDDNPFGIVCKLMLGGLSTPIHTAFSEDENEVEYPLYDEHEYFHKTPRFVYTIQPLELNVDPPPGKNEERESSLLLTVGPMITMSMTSVMTGYMSISNVLNGDSTWQKAIPSLVICGAMMASVFIWPMFSRRYEKKQRRKNEKLRQQKYSDYIESKREAIVNAKKDQTNILINNYPNTKTAEEIILQKYSTLWQRRIEDPDYLEINLGYGNFPMKIDIHYPEDHFSMVEDNLKDMVSKLGNEPKLLSNVPVAYSFYHNYVSGIIGHEMIRSEYMRRMLIQILAFHSYDDLKIIILTDEENEYQWKFLKDIPHVFTDDKSLRFFATNNDEYKEVCYYLDQIFDARKESFGTNEVRKENLNQLYLIITDCFKKVRDFDIIHEILDHKTNYGFSMVILDDKITNLPDQCKMFIELNQKTGEVHSIARAEDVIKFECDFTDSIDYDAVSFQLANIPIEFNSNDEGQLPNKLSFLEMYDIGKIEQLNVPVRWQESNPMLNLQVPVGVGKNGEKISIDLHEKYHGPHGLIAGMTGSGKSEFIITYILSMALNYHPYEVQFILIDYKGGGLAGAFENKNTGVKLPHLVGTITNLDANEIKRSLASIESELKRRQALFNKAREVSGESTIDIYKYQKMYREHIIDEPVSHLFIISDEFAELKNQQPEFMEQLISTARIGRSLGVHLILATQKPSGVVDPQIWSNTRFRVCMRVQDKSDSNEVIKCPDAAYLKHTGRFYFQVGYNEVFTLGQAAWAGGKYIPSEKVNKTIDTSINFINHIGYPIKTVETREKREENMEANGEELLNIVKYLDEVAASMNLKSQPLWLEKIPEEIHVEDLAQKYHYEKENFVINPIIGEYDIPSNQEQKLLTLPLSKEGNALIYGASGSGKENFITTLLYSSMLYYSPMEVNYYIIDFGSQSLKMFSSSPIVGDILSSDEEDKIKNLYKMIDTTIEVRKELFQDYNGDYQNYCKNSGKTLPNIVVIINNYESYQETYADLDDTLVMLSRECNKYGIYFVITVNTPNGARFKLKQNFASVYSLQQNNDEDYMTILGNVQKVYPAKIFGRGIFKNDKAFEFQTALVTEKDMIPKFIKEKCEAYRAQAQVCAKSVPVLPKVVKLSDVAKEIGKTNELVIGLNKNDLEVSKFDFKKNYATMVTGLDLAPLSRFINPLIHQMISLNREKILLIQADEFEIDQISKSGSQYINQDFNGIFTSLNEFIAKQKEVYEQNNFDKKIFENTRGITCVIIGIESFKNKLNDENKLKFAELFNNAKDLGLIHFIFVDSIDKFKKIELEAWYKNCVNNTNGIWIGNGINDQFSLKISQRINELKEDIPLNFCFVVNRGKPVYVKYVEEFEKK